MLYILEPETWTTGGDGLKCLRTSTVISHLWLATRMPSLGGRIPSLTARRASDRPTEWNRELMVAEGVRTGLGPPCGAPGSFAVFGLFLIDKSTFPPPLVNCNRAQNSDKQRKVVSQTSQLPRSRKGNLLLRFQVSNRFVIAGVSPVLPAILVTGQASQPNPTVTSSRPPSAAVQQTRCPEAHGT
jgi:hypothetical protein